MNILFITPDHSMQSSGVTTVVSQLADRIISFDNSDIEITIASVGGTSVSQDERILVKMFAPQGLATVWRWPYRLVDAVTEIVKREKIDAIHVHGIWREINLAGLEVGRCCNLPVIVSPHGMLEPWLWEQQGLISKLKKKIYFDSILKKSVPDSLYVHAVTEMENKNLKGYFPLSKIITIPNAIDFSGTEKIKAEKVDSDSPYIMFLGRMHPKKGIDILLEAFAVSKLSSQWKLKIAGPEEDPIHVESLKSYVKQHGLGERVSFLGPVYGEKKYSLLQKAWVLAVPSYSEVVGMVNLEAALCRTPSITTFETGLWDWEQGGGKLIHPELQELTKALQQASKWSESERVERGARSHDFVKENYSWGAVLPKWVALYHEMESK